MNRRSDPHPPVKITFIGDSGVGKTSMVERFVRDSFSDRTSSTIGAAFVSMRFALHEHDPGRTYHIWDTAGQERYNALIPLYVSGAAVIVIVYDMTKRRTFERIAKHWIPFIRQNLRLQEDEELPMLYMLGNKTDLVEDGLSKRQVTKEEASEFAKQNDMGFHEVSAKTGFGAKEVFRKIAEYADDLAIRHADALKLARSTVFLEDDNDKSWVSGWASTGCCWQ